ncbi:MAG: hypothetical protein KIT89_04300 [Microcella sp.]|uniref:glycine-rich protein n=1 Tax=Microcella sp. TaxID=1913979 RepID=UPI0024C8F8B2|nr:glycine-rich protein [Microcella sp.]UYN84419.1 MAG: hypothetical protein KIT89_04300 [Microcella sp.]
MTLVPRATAATSATIGLAALALVMTSVAPAAAADLAPVDERFDVADVASNGFTTWTVPTNICSIDVTAAGGNGGAATERPGASRGLGAIIATRTTVTPGDVLTVAVGARGVDGRPGGEPGGGTSYFQGGGGGGGWSGLATGAVPSHANVVIVAGAGGAAGNWMTAHGGNAGANAPDVYYEWGPAWVGGGKAGTDTQGGAGGTGALTGWPGTALAGGTAQSTGGGGGAGYFGGGGGTVNYVQSGGGGGSSFPLTGSADRLSFSIKQVTDPDNGWVVISFDPTDAADTCMTPVTSASGPNGEPLAGQTVGPGDTFELEGSDWPAGEVLTFSFETPSTALGTVTVGLDGTFTFTGLVPNDATPGAHRVVLTPTSATLATVRYDVTVAEVAAPGVDGPELADTGVSRDTVLTTAVAAVALLLAAGALAGARHRRGTAAR